MPTLSPPLLPHWWTDKRQECEAEAFVILMSGRPDQMIFSVCGFFGGGGYSWSGRECQGVGWQGLSVREADRQAGCGNGWQRPSASCRGLLWVYQTTDPPSFFTQETFWQLNGEIISMRRMGSGWGGESYGGMKMSKRELWMNLVGRDRDLERRAWLIPVSF